jgi:hypothetical protein
MYSTTVTVELRYDYDTRIYRYLLGHNQQQPFAISNTNSTTDLIFDLFRHF